MYFLSSGVKGLRLGMSLFREVPVSSEFRQDINRLSPFRSSRVAVSRPCR